MLDDLRHHEPSCKSQQLKSTSETMSVRRFGRFALDDERRQLTLEGRPVKLTGQALDLLCLLVARAGEMVSREDIRRTLWPDTHVDFEHGLDVVVGRLRAVLEEAGATPGYIETVPRKGYRFVEPVSRPGQRRWMRRVSLLLGVAALAALLAIAFAHTRYDRFVPHRAQPARTR
jgi:DNA-binding winged helix-turn-helix (wHTH) protein